MKDRSVVASEQLWVVGEFQSLSDISVVLV